MVLFFTHIPFVVNHTINATPPERWQQYTIPGDKKVKSAVNYLFKNFGESGNIDICL